MPALRALPDPTQTLQLRQRERSAFSCLDDEGHLHWVRVFEGTIDARTEQLQDGATHRLETPTGAPVVYVEGQLYLMWSASKQDWMELEALQRDMETDANVEELQSG